MRLKDKVAIITGAGQGIGFACAERFVAEGARVVIAEINEEQGQKAETAIRDAGGEALFIACDVGDKASIDAMVAQTVKTFGSLDIHINNAAILHSADFLDLQGGGESVDQGDGLVAG